jgi:glycosyltransferase involved in cell wall biosynthesis
MSAYSPHQLRLAIESILAQTFTDFEFVIVDDSATAGTAAILDEYAARDPRLVIERNAQNRGQTWSLNRGFALTRAALIARQDDDDISEPERLAQQVAYLDAHPAVGLLGTQAQIINLAGAPQRLTDFPTAPEAVAEGLLRDCILCHGSVMFRRALLERVGNFDADLKPAEDYDLWLRLAAVTQVANLDQPLYQFRIHTGSQSFKRRHMQLFNKARGLARALARRYGEAIPTERLAAPARDYLEAAVAGVYVSDLPFAHEALGRALKLYPAIAQGEQPMQALLDEYTHSLPVEEQLRLVDGVFGLFTDPTPDLRQRQARYRAEVHMRAVFTGARGRPAAQLRRHLWQGIRHNPRWLLNRGVLSLALRSLKNG